MIWVYMMTKWVVARWGYSIILKSLSWLTISTTVRKLRCTWSSIFRIVLQYPTLTCFPVHSSTPISFITAPMGLFQNISTKMLWGRPGWACFMLTAKCWKNIMVPFVWGSRASQWTTVLCVYPCKEPQTWRSTPLHTTDEASEVQTGVWTNS